MFRQRFERKIKWKKMRWLRGSSSFMGKQRKIGRVAASVSWQHSFSFFKRTFSPENSFYRREHKTKNRNTTPLIYSSREWLVIKVTTFLNRSRSLAAVSSLGLMIFFHFLWPGHGTKWDAIHRRYINVMGHWTRQRNRRKCYVTFHVMYCNGLIHLIV